MTGGRERYPAARHLSTSDLRSARALSAATLVFCHSVLIRACKQRRIQLASPTATARSGYGLLLCSWTYMMPVQRRTSAAYLELL